MNLTLAQISDIVSPLITFLGFMVAFFAYKDSQKKKEKYDKEHLEKRIREQTQKDARINADIVKLTTKLELCRKDREKEVDKNFGHIEGEINMNQEMLNNLKDEVSNRIDSLEDKIELKFDNQNDKIDNINKNIEDLKLLLRK